MTEAPAETAVETPAAPQVIPLNAGPDIGSWSLDKRASYVMGYIVSQQIQQQINQGGFEGPTVLDGLSAGIRGEKPVVPQDTWNEIMNQYQQKAVEARNLASMKAKAEEEQYVADLKAKEGITFTESGLAYEVLTQGEGDKPSATDTVRVHYHGTLINGTVFDSSVERGSPVEFPLNRVIAGWTEGLQLMNAGSKFRFHIPAALAYGEQGSSRIPRQQPPHLRSNPPRHRQVKGFLQGPASPLRCSRPQWRCQSSSFAAAPPMGLVRLRDYMHPPLLGAMRAQSTWCNRRIRRPAQAGRPARINRRSRSAQARSAKSKTTGRERGRAIRRSSLATGGV